MQQLKIIMEDLQDLILVFKIPIGMRKSFFEIHRIWASTLKNVRQRLA